MVSILLWPRGTLYRALLLCQSYDRATEHVLGVDSLLCTEHAKTKEHSVWPLIVPFVRPVLLWGMVGPRRPGCRPAGRHTLLTGAKGPWTHFLLIVTAKEYGWSWGNRYLKLLLWSGWCLLWMKGPGFRTARPSPRISAQFWAMKLSYRGPDSRLYGLFYVLVYYMCYPIIYHAYIIYWH